MRHTFSVQDLRKLAKEAGVHGHLRHDRVLEAASMLEHAARIQDAAEKLLRAKERRLEGAEAVATAELRQAIGA